ncbi:MAG: hypothetical protein A2Y20_05115 [Firmicutes bacterium GWF2_51_9]|nr:MAG: hypothetical protein A2Y20_05115 [Firmicutes bacterium GWF2_51_9]
MKNNEFGTMLRSIIANVNSFIGSNVEKFGMKHGQFEYFLLIFATPGINQLDIARQKNVDKASVTKALKILETDGFIVRKPDEKDKRNTLCILSEKGETIVNELLHVRKSVEIDLFDGFSQEEKAKALEYVARIDENSRKLFKSPYVNQ